MKKANLVIQDAVVQGRNTQSLFVTRNNHLTCTLIFTIYKPGLIGEKQNCRSFQEQYM